MEAKAMLSVFCGLFFAIPMYFVYKGDHPLFAFWLAVWSGACFALMLFTYLLIHEKVMNKKYAEIEKTFLSPVFYKTNGNFKLNTGKIKNGNIYFCDDGIICLSLDGKPYLMEEILLQNVARIQFDDQHLNIITNDTRSYFITLPDAKKIVEILKEKDWI